LRGGEQAGSLEPAVRLGFGAVDRQLDGLFQRMSKLEAALSSKGEGLRPSLSQLSEASPEKGEPGSEGSLPAGSAQSEEGVSSLSEPMAAIGERLASLDERLAQSSRRERRSMAALDTLLQGQDKLLGMLSGDPAAELEAVMDFGEALTVFIWPLAMSPDSKDARVVVSKLLGLLKAFKLRLTGLPGEKFDPALHEAVHVESVPALEEGMVIQTVRPGFLSDLRVLRYASVVVNRKLAKLSEAEELMDGQEAASAGPSEPPEPSEIHQADGYEIAEPVSDFQGPSEIHQADGYEIVEPEGESSASQDDEPSIPSSSFEHLLTESNLPLEGLRGGPAGSSGQDSGLPLAQTPPPGQAGAASEASYASGAPLASENAQAEASQAEDGEAAESDEDLSQPPEIPQAGAYEIAGPESETRISQDNELSIPSDSFEHLLAESNLASANHEVSLADSSAGSSGQESGADLPEPPPPIQAGAVSEASEASEEPREPSGAVSGAEKRADGLRGPVKAKGFLDYWS
jgi:molecular chaperone GrpE